jgi:hypothetical protein
MSLSILSFGIVFAAIIASSNSYYEVSSDTGVVCITWPAWYLSAYDLIYYNTPTSPHLFIPKKTSAEFQSFINAGIVSNSFHVTYLFNENSAAENNCGSSGEFTCSLPWAYATQEDPVGGCGPRSSSAGDLVDRTCTSACGAPESPTDDCRCICGSSSSTIPEC